MDGCNLVRFTKRALLAAALFAAIQCAGAPAHSYAAKPWPHGARIHNPFCNVPTYVEKRLMTQGQAFIDLSGHPVIYIGTAEAAGDRAYRDYLMAHECCHHTRGHLKRLLARGHDHPHLSLSAVARGMELDADCCAAAALAKTKRLDAIREAARRMKTFGAMPTGSGGYPSGDLRAELIENCAVRGNRPLPPLEPPVTRPAAVGPRAR